MVPIGQNEAEYGQVITITEANGYTIHNIPVGTYTLVEKKAPDGYVILTSNIEFTVSADGEGVVVATESSIATADNTTDPSQLIVSNSAGVELPMTGSTGDTLYLLGGLSLMTMALLAVIGQNSKARRRHARAHR